MAETVAQEIIDKKGEAIAVKADVTDEASVEKAIKAITGKWGRLTIGVNNAGLSIWADSETQARADWDKVITLNLTGVYLCCKHEGRTMLESKYGKIINTASMSGHIVNTPQNQVGYNTSKAGVIHLSRSLAAEWATRGVRVNSISPGYTRTKLVEDFLKTPAGQNAFPIWMERTPVHKMLDVTDLQGAVVYLSSPASDFMTGADMVIDGGYCAW
jgi:NAD(P)-dependent dehydrogenase (short-subunit alcohol dehydrogenase family)